MASDQRYCIQCGERRAGGGLREALPRTQSAAPPAQPKQRRKFFASPNASLIAGVATLLLAMGVGVLIGRAGHNTPAVARSAPAQIITVPTGSSGAGASNSTAAGAAATTAAATRVVKHKAAKTHRKAAAAKAAPKTDLQKTAAKSGVKLPPPVVKVGQTCTKGTAGCQNGKFTGNYFGGG